MFPPKLSRFSNRNTPPTLAFAPRVTRRARVSRANGRRRQPPPEIYRDRASIRSPSPFSDRRARDDVIRGHPARLKKRRGRRSYFRSRARARSAFASLRVAGNSRGSVERFSNERASRTYSYRFPTPWRVTGEPVVGVGWGGTVDGRMGEGMQREGEREEGSVKRGLAFA
jgi:hypothetical protein